ncbi:MAG: acetyl-CoA carboxylase carboxyltransferase subunit alpha [Alphaproteobacteria bacterium]
MQHYLDFEKSIAELEGKIEELRHLTSSNEVNIADEIARLQVKVEKALHQTYTSLVPWQKVQVARHPNRPQFFDYLEQLIEGFIPLAGDRLFANDQAIVGGLGRFNGRSVVVIGHQKGSDTEMRLQHNFGMAKPEGYRKAVRLMNLAHRFHLPVIAFVDTAGAYPGIEAEERGQAVAIAESIATCLKIRVPLISILIGEGGSGGAIALAAANAILMLEHSTYSVISPEGCASILWRTSSKAAEAANALKLTAEDLLKLGVIDQIIPEPIGGAHRHPKQVIDAVGKALDKTLQSLINKDGAKLLSMRRDKFLAMGRKGIG